MKTGMLRCLALFAVILALSAAQATAASPGTGDLIKFVPYLITVRTNQVVVDGYFVNMNDRTTVKNFREFKMKVYEDGDLLADGDFGTINSFSIAPLRMKYQSFTFNGSHSLKTGTYVAGDRYYCVVSMRFTSTE